MVRVQLSTQIAAPPERCFSLSLSIDLHKASAHKTGEQAIAGVTQGLIGAGETVTWRGRHFGIWLTQTTSITEYREPDWFQDTMTQGVFHSFVHDHSFQATSNGGTSMHDELRFEAPLGPLGRIAERMVLRAYLTRFLVERNEVIRKVAEDAQLWRLYLPE